MLDAGTALDPVHVETTGSGPPLVLVHGFAMHGGLFAPLLPALSRRHRVHVVDIPGHGLSPPIADFRLPRLAAAIDDSIDDESPVTVVGWSLGGQIALQWALERPGRVERLVLVATTPSFVQREGWPHAIGGDTLARFGDELEASYRLTLLRFLALQVHGSDEGRATLAGLRRRLFERGEPSSSTLAAALDLLDRVDLRMSLPQIGARALVIGGDRDALVPLRATTELARLLPNAAHATIEGAAHAPFLSHPAAFAALALPFVDG